MVLRRNPISGEYYESSQPSVLPFRKMSEQELKLWGNIGLASTIGGLAGATVYGLQSAFKPTTKIVSTAGTGAGTGATVIGGGTLATTGAFSLASLIPLAMQGTKLAWWLIVLDWLKKNWLIVVVLLGLYVYMKQGKK